MITVAILINGQPIMARSATNIGNNKYSVDDGSVIEHDADAGAVPLAIKLLQTIKEQDTPKPRPPRMPRTGWVEDRG